MSPKTADNVPDFTGLPDAPTKHDAVKAAEWLEGRQTFRALYAATAIGRATSAEICERSGCSPKEVTRLKEAGLIEPVSDAPERYVMTTRGVAAINEAGTHKIRRKGVEPPEADEGPPHPHDQSDAAYSS